MQALLDYIEHKVALNAPLIMPERHDNIKAAVVIPALAEYDNLFHTLDALAENDPALLAQTLVICVVNNRGPHICRPDEIADNQRTLRRLEEIRRAGTSPRLAYVDASSPAYQMPDKGGVGLARKIGLDWAVKQLNSDGARPRAPLISLDADTLVEPNYLAAIFDHFSRNDAWAAVIDYAHQIEGEYADAIVSYELFLRYHELGLAHSESPYAFHTIGSAMCCSAGAYAAVSGMNQRQAGEDFYFLQQLAKTGPMHRITGTTVHPSGRASHRVPFGTGRRVLDYAASPEDARLTYDIRSYQILRDWLATVARNLDSNGTLLLELACDIAPELHAFLRARGFMSVWDGLRKNARNDAQLLAQFHRWFDGFATMKLFHYLRDNSYPRRDLFESIHALLEIRGCPATAPNRSDADYPRQLLDFMRGLTLHPPSI
jgi:hypothetical protein